MNTDAVARFTAPHPASLTKRVDPELDEIVMRALERDPDKRWPSADAMREALSAWLVRKDPTVSQESVAKFLRQIFGETGEREREQREALIREALDSLPATSSPGLAAVPAASSQTKLFVRGLQASGPGAKRSADANGMKGGPDTLVGSMAGRAAQPTPSTAMAAGQPPTLEELERIDPGTVIEDRYRVLTMLGRGGMGTVYLGEHLTVGRQVAIKVLTHQWSADPAISKRFRAEARSASAAGHQHIIEVFDAGELDDGRLYLVMEFLTGRNLFEEVQATGPMKVARACRIMRQVARAIRAAHGVGVIHRDLKPDNVMLVDRDDAENDFVKVLDFGISSHGAAGENEADRLTRPGLAIGTPEYMAPEQAMGREVTPSFDIYALGVIFYELLTGDPPILSDNAVEILARKSGEDAPSIAIKRTDLSDELISLIDECLSRNPEERPASAEVFLKRLESVLRALPREMSEGTKMALAASQAAAQAEAVREAVEVVSTAEETKRGRSLMWAFGGVAAALIGIGGVVAFAASKGNKESDTAADTAVADDDRTQGGAPAEGGAEPPAEEGAAGPDPTGEAPQPAGEGGPDGGDSGGKQPATTGPEPTDTAADLPSVEPDEETGDEPQPEVVPKHKTAECTKARQSAKEAQGKRNWDGMLKHTKDKKCWAKRSEVTKLRVKALSEKGSWSQCVKEGSGSSDSSVKKLVKLCETQLGK